jgi:hypothetical protein
MSFNIVQTQKMKISWFSPFHKQIQKQRKTSAFQWLCLRYLLVQPMYIRCKFTETKTHLVRITMTDLWQIIKTYSLLSVNETHLFCSVKNMYKLCMSSTNFPDPKSLSKQYTVCPVQQFCNLYSNKYIFSSTITTTQKLLFIS